MTEAELAEPADRARPMTLPAILTGAAAVADLTGAVLTRATLAGARWSRRTVWPDQPTESAVTAASCTVSRNDFVVGDLKLPMAYP
jgi:hypothetical protein